MARPQMESNVDGQSPQSCRMEFVCGNTLPAPLSRSRRRTTATQTTSAPLPLAPAPDALNTSLAPQLDGPLRESRGSEQEWSCTDGRLQHLHAAPAQEEPTAEEQAVARVAIQLRTIGDEMNAAYLQRRNEVAQWQNWRGVYRGLLAFLADTISTLYQHGLR